jgi:hypothetical protein
MLVFLNLSLVVFIFVLLFFHLPKITYEGIFSNALPILWLPLTVLFSCFSFLNRLITHPKNGKFLILSCPSLILQNHFQKFLVRFQVQPLTNSF